MTWMTPFEAITSGVVTRALFTKTFESRTHGCEPSCRSAF